jgi:hypothetical protein
VLRSQATRGKVHIYLRDIFSCCEHAWTPFCATWRADGAPRLAGPVSEPGPLATYI